MRVPGKSQRRGPQWQCKRVGGLQLMRQQVWPGIVPGPATPMGRQAGGQAVSACPVWSCIYVSARTICLCATHPGCREGVPARCFSTKFCSGWRPGQTAPWRLCALRHVLQAPPLAVARRND